MRWGPSKQSTRVRVQRKAKAEVWCLLINADASLSGTTEDERRSPRHRIIERHLGRPHLTQASQVQRPHEL